jgi:hypothetical protein
MKREQAKRILLFCRDIDGEIAMNRRVLRDFEDRYYTMGGGGTLDDMPRSKHKVSSPTESAVLNIPESASEEMHDLRTEMENLAALHAAILKELNKLSLTQKTILYDFYISGLQWVQIEERVHYSGTQCKKIRNRALDNLAKNFSANALIKNFNYPN